MAELLSANGYADRFSATQLANGTVQVGDLAPFEGGSRRTRAASSTASPTVSLVIPVKNEARNIAWVLEQISDDVRSHRSGVSGRLVQSVRKGVHAGDRGGSTA